MKNLSHRELKQLANIFSKLKLHEKNNSLRKHYDDIHYHLKVVSAYLYGTPYFSIKEQLKKGWIQ